MKDTLKFYNSIYEPLFAKGYTKECNRARPALRRSQKYFDANNIKIESVIDVGCAWGKALGYWKKMGAKAIGIDVSKKAVKACLKKGYEAHIASATDLSFIPDNSFDLYMSTDVYEHLRPEDIKPALLEAMRVSKKFILLRIHPVMDSREKLHLTVKGSKEWYRIFETEYKFNILDIGDNGQKYYKSCFLLENTK